MLRDVMGMSMALVALKSQTRFSFGLTVVPDAKGAASSK